MTDISCLFIAHGRHISYLCHGCLINLKCHIRLVVWALQKCTFIIHGMSCMNIQNAVTFQHTYTAGCESRICVYRGNTAASENIPIVIILYNPHDFFFIGLFGVHLLIYNVTGILSLKISSGCPNTFGELSGGYEVKISIVGFQKYTFTIKEGDAKKRSVFIFLKKVITWLCVPSQSPCLFAVVVARHGLGFLSACRTMDIRVIRLPSVIDRRIHIRLCRRIRSGADRRIAGHNHSENQ